MAVYFIRNDRGFVKIGHSRDPVRRLRELQDKALQCGAFDNYSIVRTIDGGQKTELWLHRRFAKRRVRGEWFEFTEEMLTVVVPDEIPLRSRRADTRESAAEHLGAANKLGLLTPRMKRDYAALLDEDAP